MAEHDPQVEAHITRVYRIETCQALFREMKPEVSDEAAEAATTLIGLATEGSCILNSSR
jgi:hypothetical protein